MHVGERIAELERENQALRERVAELERAVLRFEGGLSSTAPNETLSEREALLVQAERIGHMGSWVWDVATHAVFWSDELFRILGYDPQVDQPSVDAYFAAVHPEDLARAQGAYSATLSSGVVASSTCRFRHADGTIRHANLAGVGLYDEQGGLKRLVGTVLDVTDARLAAERAERALSVLAEAQRIAQVGSWALELATNKLEWSDELRRILGVTPLVPPSLELFFSRAHPDDRERLVAIYERALSGGESSAQVKILRPDGSIRHVHMVGSPVRDQHGQLIELRGTVLDITERVGLEEQLLRGQKLEAVGRLSGGIAHDFNNLLTVILSNADLLRRELSDKPMAFLDQIDHAAELASKLTRQLLAFARRAHLEPQVVVLNEILVDAITMTRRLLPENVGLESAFAPELWATRVDLGQLQQILINLVVNARDAMPRGGMISVQTSNELVAEGAMAEIQAGEYVVLSVTDTGAGMPPAVRARIFEPFFTTKAEGQGFGLGLAVVFGAAAQHGGGITVQSDPGKGTTFSVYFPRVDAVPRRRVQPVASSPAPAKGRILVVEDAHAVAQVMCITLRAAGYEVRLAHLPSDAIDAWQSEGESFDLVISDVMMPQMRGPELIAELERLRAVPRVLFVTGYGPELFGDAAATRKHAVLAKPFNADALLDTVRRLLGT